jgi:hypothetical protein
VRLANGFPLRAWLAVPAAAAIDWTSRWKVALRMLRIADATEKASPAVRAVELRATLRDLLGAMPDAHLPRPDMSVTGPDAAGVYASWLVRLAGVLGDVAA